MDVGVGVHGRGVGRAVACSPAVTCSLAMVSIAARAAAGVVDAQHDPASWRGQLAVAGEQQVEQQVDQDVGDVAGRRSASLNFPG